MGAPRGILFIAFGEYWVEECKRAISSIRRVSNLPIAVVAEAEWDAGVTPEYFVIREKAPGYASKPRYIFSGSPFEQTLFLDTDTLTLSDPEPVFGLLEYYDVGVRFGGPMLSEGPALKFHTQCNSGVMLFKKTPVVAEMFADWNSLYQEAALKFADAGDLRGLNDQRSLSIALARSKARPAHLAEYLNFALFETIYTYSPVVILHGRDKYLRQIGDAINQNWNVATDWQARLWLQNIKGLLPRGVRRSDPLLALSLVLRRFANELDLRIRKYAVRPASRTDAGLDVVIERPEVPAP